MKQWDGSERLFATDVALSSSYLNVMMQLVEILSGQWGGGHRADNCWTSFGFFSVRQVEFKGGDDAAVSHLPRVLHNVDTELQKGQVKTFLAPR